MPATTVIKERPAPATTMNWRAYILVVTMVLGAAAMWCFSPGISAAETCDPMMKDRLPLFEMTFDVGGDQRIERRLLLPAGKELLVLAQERGVDVRLELKAGDTVVAQADNPVLRTGTQRLTFQASSSVPYVLNIVGKEPGAPAGQTDVRITVAGETGTSTCADLNRLLAAADESFVRGQLVTLGLSTNDVNAEAAYSDSAKQYAQVAASLTAAGNSVQLADAHHAEAGALYWGVGDWEGACAAAVKAKQIYEAMGLTYQAIRASTLVAEALVEVAPSKATNCGSIPGREQESHLERARQLLAEAIEFHASRGEVFDQALASNDLAFAHQNDDRFEEALAEFNRSLSLYARSGAKPQQGKVLQNMAWVDFLLGRYSTALPLYGKALKLLGQRHDKIVYTAVLNNSGLANAYVGDYDMALRQLGEGLAIARRLQDKGWQATTLNNIGLTYKGIGDREVALDFFGQSLAAGKDLQNTGDRANTLSNMATIYREKGEYQRAQEAREEALAKAASPNSRNRYLVELAADYRIAGKYDQAATALRSVLDDPSATLSTLTRARGLLERARLGAARSQFAQAESDLRQAGRIFHSLDVQAGELTSSLELAGVMARQNRTDDALRELNQTLKLAEEVRRQSANPELRARLLETSRPAFDLKISILAKRYFAEPNALRRDQLAREALQTSEQARARALMDYTRLDMTAGGASADLLKQRESTYSELSARRQGLESSLETSAKSDARVAVIRADIAMLRQKLNDIDAQLAAASIRTAPADNQLRIDIAAIPDDLAIVEYWLGAERALCWTITQRSVVLTDLGSSPAITAAAMSLHTSLRALGSIPVQERLLRSQQLHDLILSPIRNYLAARTKLTVAADGALHYVPFSALRSREGVFLVQDFEIAVTPSVRALLQQPSAGSPLASRMLLVADPVYSSADSRLGTQPRQAFANNDDKTRRGHPDVQGTPRLPGTGAEASAIVSSFGSEKVDVLRGLTASRERFLRTDFRAYRYIHIASHAMADTEIPQLSALILSTVDTNGKPVNGRVLAADLLSTRLNAELVVLSGCETALGKNIAGEGLVGLQYVMLARGARTVISSLWDVPDRRTAELMSRFYVATLRQQLSPLSALSITMRSMIAEKIDPGLWSAFNLTTTDLQSRSVPTVESSSP